MATVNINGATIVATAGPFGDFRFEVTLPSGETYRANSINGVVDGARNLRRDPEGADIRALDQIIASFAQVQGPALEAQVRAEIQRNRVPPPPPPEPPPAQSASQQVATQTNQAPQPLPSAAAAPAADTGTNAPVKSLEQTQAITTASNSGISPSAEPGAGVSPAVLTAGQGAQDDATPSLTPVQAVDATETVQPRIAPRPNILDEFASYTYSASVYMLSQEQYEQILISDSKRVDGYNLLFQSAGAAVNRGGPRDPGTAGAATDTAADAGRNPFFDNDFYIDAVTLETIPLGKGSGTAHNASSLKFTVVEPNGITLLDRLYDAVANFEPRDGTGRVNYTAVSYLMVIRFYGYDSLGRPVQVRSRDRDAEGVSDQQAVIEKFVPFRINNINWSVSSKMVTYEWECTPIGQQIGGYTTRGTIPYDISLTETTVGKLLSGTAKYSGTNANPGAPGAATTATGSDPRFGTRDDARQGRGFQAPPPAKADAAPTDKTTLTSGLADAMNRFQQDLVRRGIYTYADEYVIEFAGPGSEKIRNAVLASAAQNPIAQTAAGAAATQNPNGLRPSTNSVDKTTKNFSITAGQQMLQVIDLVIRNSSYIYDQAAVIIEKDGSVKPNPNVRDQPVQWYNISMQAERISTELDPQRNDYAYRITYVISPFVVKNLNSRYFPVPDFSGVHKSYPYWFTGQNTAVLDYSETLNALYHLTISGEVPGDSDAKRKQQLYTSSLADIIKYAYSPRSSESSAGAQGKINELAANAAEAIYSPSDLAEATVKIVGDPDWIQQGTIFRGVDDRALGIESYNTGFLPDGSISFDTQDILFDIVWKRPNDYSIATGKADPYARSESRYNNYSAEQSRVYQCTKVTSEFRQGRFEQTLTGALYMFPKPDLTNTANPAAAAAADSLAADGRPQAQSSSNSNIGTVDPAIQNILRRQQASAAGVGGQSNTSIVKVPPAPVGINNGGAALNIPQLVDDATVPVALFSQPLPPTTGTATPVPSVVFAAPGRLPAADPTVGRLTTVQIQDLVQQQTSNVNTNPRSATNPARQRGAIEP